MLGARPREGVVKDDAPAAVITRLVPPAILRGAARKRFDCVAAELQGFIPPLVTGVDAMLVAQYVLVEAEVNALTRAVQSLGKGGVYATKDRNGKTLAYAVRPEVEMLRSRRYELLQLMQQLGMTPRSRSSMKGTRTAGGKGAAGNAAGAGAGAAGGERAAAAGAAGGAVGGAGGGLDALAAGGGPADPLAAGVTVGGRAQTVQMAVQMGGGAGGREATT